MTRSSCVLLAVGWLWPAAAATAPPAQTPAPAWAEAQLGSPEFTEVYSLSARLQPSRLEADFDGDGRMDLAVLVARRATGQEGIAFLHAGSTQPFVVGAGRALGNGGEDFAWMDAWSVYPKARVVAGAGSGAPPRLRGDALLVEKREAASALVYWDGRAYRWYQQGD